MYTLESIKQKLNTNVELAKRIEILKLASEINPKFKNPNIVGGFLRDTILDFPPNDCDVVFDGYMREQPGIVECVKEAEDKLGCKHYADWEFENFNANGISGNMFEDCIGFYSQHYDYLTLMLYDSNGKLLIGSDKTVEVFNKKLYEIRYQALAVWIGIRGRSYFRALCGVTCRGLYLSHKLNLNIHPSAVEVFERFETNFAKLNETERKDMIAYWKKKTTGLVGIQTLLDTYKITSLN